MLDSLKLTMRKGQYTAGIYEAGDVEKCYTKLFVTDSGRVLPVNHRGLTEDDLLQVYSWGREDAFAEMGKPIIGEDGADSFLEDSAVGSSPKQEQDMAGSSSKAPSLSNEPLV